LTITAGICRERNGVRLGWAAPIAPPSRRERKQALAQRSAPLQALRMFFVVPALRTGVSRNIAAAAIEVAAGVEIPIHVDVAVDVHVPVDVLVAINVGVGVGVGVGVHIAIEIRIGVGVHVAI